MTILKVRRRLGTLTKFKLFNHRPTSFMYTHSNQYVNQSLIFSHFNELASDALRLHKDGNHVFFWTFISNIDRLVGTSNSTRPTISFPGNGRSSTFSSKGSSNRQVQCYETTPRGKYKGQ